MQVKKEEVKNKILEIAKLEFLNLGYQKASLREIAKKSGVTKGNIYTYFGGKDDLFCELAKPAMDVFEKELYSEGSYEMYEDVLEPVYSTEISIESFKYHAKCINEYRDEMKLLFFCSDGSSYSNYRERIAKQYEKSSQAYMKSIKRLNPEFENNISYLFFHTLAQMYLGFVEEILLHNPSDNELDKYIVEMSLFISSGFKSVFEYHKL